MPDRRPDRRLHDEAIALVMASHDDPGAEQQARLDEWQSRSAAHRSAMEHAKSDWALMGRVEDVPLGRGEAIRLAVASRMASWIDHPTRLGVPLGLAAAAIIAWVGVARFDSVGAPEQDVPAVAEAELASPEPEEFRTRRREQRTVALADGTEVWLDWNTRMRVTLGQSARQVTLVEGKALFKVEHEVGRPFSVVADGVVATALGTEFSVQRLTGATVEVAVIEGAVGVVPAAGSPSTRLSPAEAVRVSGGEAGTVTARTLAEIAGWRDGIVVFENRPLVEALETLEPYTSYRIETRYLLNPGQPVSGTFFVDKGDSALRALMQSYALTGDVEGRNTLVLRSLSPGRPMSR